jgi:hypothetical protein
MSSAYRRPVQESPGNRRTVAGYRRIAIGRGPRRHILSLLARPNGSGLVVAVVRSPAPRFDVAGRVRWGGLETLCGAAPPLLTLVWPPAWGLSVFGPETERPANAAVTLIGVGICRHAGPRRTGGAARAGTGTAGAGGVRRRAGLDAGGVAV